MHLRGVPRVDWALAASVLVIAELEIIVGDIASAPVAMATALAASTSLAFRRAAPVAVMIVCVGAQVVNQWAGVPVSEVVAPVLWIFISLYTVARYCALRRAAASGLIALVMFGSTLFTDSSDWFFGLVVLGGPWLVGRAIRASASQTARLSVRMTDLERRREGEVAAALADERARIARDLHDVIAHSVTVMLVHAGAAQQVMLQDPSRADASLTIVQDSGRQALTEMSTLVGMLHQEGSGDGLSPQPGVDQLDALVAQCSGTGVETTLEVVGDPRHLPPGIQVSLYRIVQESLTNTRKHSSARRACVRLTYLTDRVDVEISDDGSATGDGLGGQRGIIGMRERVAIYGGSLDAGPAPASGYRVHASIPIGSTP
jgi:signal transduction histidine kinase